MKPPEGRITPPDFGVEHNDANELERGNHNAHGNGVADAYDMQALIDGFKQIEVDERTIRLLHLWIASQAEDKLTREDLANHIADDRQEFAIINDDLDYLKACSDLIMKNLGIDPPPRPKVRPRRRG